MVSSNTLADPRSISTPPVDGNCSHSLYTGGNLEAKWNTACCTKKYPLQQSYYVYNSWQDRIEPGSTEWTITMLCAFYNLFPWYAAFPSTSADCFLYWRQQLLCHPHEYQPQFALALHVSTVRINPWLNIHTVQASYIHIWYTVKSCSLHDIQLKRGGLLAFAQGPTGMEV